RLYAERASELELEARLAERAGHDGFASLARQRHAEGTAPEWAEARRLARAFCELPPSDAAETRHAADDRRAPDSLVSVLAREIGERRLPLRVEAVSALASRASCGDGVIYVRAGEPLTAPQARRIAMHELCGHALPRLEARAHPLGLVRVGSARSSDDEEGRALHIEAQHGLLDSDRKRELGLRHTAAVAVAGGAGAHECVNVLGRFGCDDEAALALYMRVARGGGLCRELEYLPAWLRFEAALARDPALAAWLAHGRLSLDAAGVLRSEGVDAHFSTCHWQPTGLPRCPT
ncbi:MAG TPA: tyrosine/phenylalanine carboxypeptidase domain-containing protein, partial [Polyangiaceae bacterium]|nr:tyrosine/phenylalanine carboxypeptidase domain-containing protein [Polyangiaceae bacterium]